jgi:hypothetical protein
MAFMTFRDWILAHESSPHTRRRRNAALGLAPPIAEPSVHSRSTAHPFEVEKLVKDLKKKRKKKKKKDKMFDEAKRAKDPKVADFASRVEALKGELEQLEDAIAKKKRKPADDPKPEPKPDKPEQEKEAEDKPEEHEEKPEAEKIDEKPKTDEEEK